MTKERQQELPQIPWPQIISMRNRLIHAYFEIDLDAVWDTVTDRAAWRSHGYTSAEV